MEKGRGENNFRNPLSGGGVWGIKRTSFATALERESVALEITNEGGPRRKLKDRNFCRLSRWRSLKIGLCDSRHLDRLAVKSGSKNIASEVRRSRKRPKNHSKHYGEFDSGSERTLAAWIRHASRTTVTG